MGGSQLGILAIRRSAPKVLGAQRITPRRDKMLKGSHLEETRLQGDHNQENHIFKDHTRRKPFFEGEEIISLRKPYPVRKIYTSRKLFQKKAN